MITERVRPSQSKFQPESFEDYVQDLSKNENPFLKNEITVQAIDIDRLDTTEPQFSILKTTTNLGIVSGRTGYDRKTAIDSNASPSGLSEYDPEPQRDSRSKPSLLRAKGNPRKKFSVDNIIMYLTT